MILVRGITTSVLALSCWMVSSSEGAQPPTVGGEVAGTIAISEFDAQGREQIFLMAPDGSQKQQLTREESAVRVAFPAWSPNGKQLAYVVISPATSPDIYAIDRRGASRRLLAGGPGPQLTPAWSPDGTRIAYMSAPWDGQFTKIWIMNTDGTGKRQVTHGSWNDAAPTWSPQGNRIAFTSNRDGALFQIWVTDLDGHETRLTKAHHDETLSADIEQKVPAWSPDGRYLAFWQGVEGTGPVSDRRLPWEIWVMNAADGSNQRRLSRGDDPVWSPDGFLVLHPDCANTDANSTGHCDLAGWVINPDRPNRTMLFRTRGQWGRPAWTRY